MYIYISSPHHPQPKAGMRCCCQCSILCCCSYRTSLSGSAPPDVPCKDLEWSLQNYFHKAQLNFCDTIFKMVHSWKKIMISFLYLSFTSHTARTKKQTIKPDTRQKQTPQPETYVEWILKQTLSITRHGRKKQTPQNCRQRRISLLTCSYVDSALTLDRRC